MCKRKRVILLDGDNSTVFSSIDAAAKYCNGYHRSLQLALKAGRKYKGFSFVLEGSDVIPKDFKRGNFTNHPTSIKVSEFRNGDLFRIHPSKRSAMRQMGIESKKLREILDGRRGNHTGKDFAVTSPLDECLMEIQERNKRPYQ